MISASEWSAMDETNYLLASPANRKRLLDGIERMNAGLGEAHELIKP